MSDPNAAQREFWTSGPGRHWVAQQAALDALHAEALSVLIDGAALPEGAEILDIGCGAGDSCLAALEAAGPGARLVGLDISEPLVALAGRRLAEAGVADRAEVRLGDAQTDRPGMFDRAISRFGMMFFADSVAALGNIRAMLRPGGRLDAVCWATPAHNPWFTLPLEIAARHLGPIPSGDPAAPGPTRFGDPAATLPLFEAAGFARAEASAHDIALRLPGGAAAATRLARHVGPFSRLLRDTGASDAQAVAILDDLAAALGAYEDAGELRMPARILLYTARTHA